MLLRINDKLSVFQGVLSGTGNGKRLLSPDFHIKRHLGFNLYWERGVNSVSVLLPLSVTF